MLQCLDQQVEIGSIHVLEPVGSSDATISRPKSGNWHPYITLAPDRNWTWREEKRAEEVMVLTPTLDGTIAYILGTISYGKFTKAMAHQKANSRHFLFQQWLALLLGVLVSQIASKCSLRSLMQWFSWKAAAATKVFSLKFGWAATSNYSGINDNSLHTERVWLCIIPCVFPEWAP